MFSRCFVLFTLILTTSQNVFAYSTACYTAAHNAAGADREDNWGKMIAVTSAVKTCAHVQSDACFKDARENGYSINEAANVCAGEINDACYTDARKLKDVTVRGAAGYCIAH